MSYYMGDFYRGDPGFGSFFGGLFKKAVGFIPGVGPALSAMIPSGGGAASRAIARVAPGPIMNVGGQVMRRVGRAIIKHPVLSGAAAAGVIGAGGVAAGRASRGMMAGGGRRHRRMNVTNVRALRRSIRRAQGFAKLAKRVLHFTSPRPVRGRALFKARRRKRTV